MHSEFPLIIRAVPLALACFLGACGSATADSNSENTAAPVAEAPAPTPTPTPTPVPVSGGVYDGSIGAGVDADGFASLPLRSGAHRFFVNSATGADSNGCSGSQQPSSPLKTIPAAIACVANGEGDQVLLAEGTSYNQDIGWLAFKQGYSATYPMVISSYDPADPANEAKYGRGDQRNARPVITALQSQLGNGTYNYYAIKGLDFNPGNVASAGFGFIGKAGYALIENNIFRYTALTFDTADFPAFPTTQKLIVRNNSIYGMWNTGGRTGGLYVAGYVGPTVEDNVFYHCGWKIGANRDDDPSVGGATVFSHSYYLQTNTTGAIVRRNLSADGAGDGGIARGDMRSHREPVHRQSRRNRGWRRPELQYGSPDRRDLRRELQRHLRRCRCQLEPHPWLGDQHGQRTARQPRPQQSDRSLA